MPDTLGDSDTSRTPQLVLASASPRRRELLRGLGLDFDVVPADVDEEALPGEAPWDMVRRLALAKADAVAMRFRDSLVIAADTVVTVDGQTLTKPASPQENLQFLERLSGRWHTVHTGHALRLGDSSSCRVVSTEVEFRPLDRAEMERYVASGEGSDKAGGYAIQGLGAALVPRISGCYFNVVGLSLAVLVDLARELGVELV